MDEYVCLTLLSNAGEAPGEFSARLSRLWTRLLRSHPDEFEKVYAETTRFDSKGEHLSRQYLIQCDIAPFLQEILHAEKIGFEPLDTNETFSKYEGSPPDWMQIEH